MHNLFRDVLKISIISGALFTLLTASFAQARMWERETVDFEKIAQRASEMAAAPYSSAQRTKLPEWIKNLSYDDYRNIRFRPESALWLDEQLPFRMMFFHLGHFFLDTVKINEFTETHSQQIRFNPAYFKYDSHLSTHSDSLSNIGFAGFRLHCALNSADYFDELISFLGASYWRALGVGQHYGISARGIAVNTGIKGIAEEFPIFREFWVKKPELGDRSVEILALLDSESLTGAYHIKVVPGKDTLVEVSGRLFLRKSVERLGIAPMSSMFWFGENSRLRFDDFRPEVHDSDGLQIKTSSDEFLWRPLLNESKELEFSFFSLERPKGFGLLQRDRSLVSYDDSEAMYHLRPSLWIQPVSGFDQGHVMLMEIPTQNEFGDNIVVLWQPKTLPEIGKPFNFSYRQFWSSRETFTENQAYVLRTKTGLHTSDAHRRVVKVDFAIAADALSQPVEQWNADVEARPLQEGAQILIDNVYLKKLDSGLLRLSFQLATGEGLSLSEQGKVELRAVLKDGHKQASEVWTYRIQL